MDQLAAFAQDRWFIIVGAIIALLIVISIVKTVLKWVLVLAIIAVVLYYGANYKDQLTGLSNKAVETVALSAKEGAVKAITAEMKDAKYNQNPDGTFTITAKSITVEGKPGADEVKVTFMKQSFSVKTDEMIKAFIEQAKKKHKLTDFEQSYEKGGTAE